MWLRGDLLLICWLTVHLAMANPASAKPEGDPLSSCGLELSCEFENVDQLSGQVKAMAVYDDGAGAALYVGGNFVMTQDGREIASLARWDGIAWSDVGGVTLDADIRALAVYDDGSGPKLYAGGFFSSTVPETTADENDSSPRREH